MSAIAIPTHPLSTHIAHYTLSHAAIATVHLIDQSPGAEGVGGVTLYFEPLDAPEIWLIPVDTTVQDYVAAIAQGIEQVLADNPVAIVGLRIWLCHQLTHPVDARPRAFRDATAQATLSIVQWANIRPFVPGKTNVGMSVIAATFPFNHSVFEQTCWWPSSDAPMSAPGNAPRWAVTTPLTSHVTVAKRSHLLSPNYRLTPADPLMGFGIQTQATLYFKRLPLQVLSVHWISLPNFK